MNALNNMEIVLLQWFRQTFACDFLDAVMPHVTAFADNGIGWIALALILLIPRKTRRTGISLGIALLIGFLTGNLLIKNIVARVRPFDFDPSIVLLIEKPHEYSFPSGHTLASFECATALFCHHRKWGLAAFAMAIVIAFSRLYLQVHYPTDVLAGALLGVAIGYIAYRINNRIFKRNIFSAEKSSKQ